MDDRFGDEERRLMHLVPAPAVRLKKRRVLSRPGVNSLLAHESFTSGMKAWSKVTSNKIWPNENGEGKD